MPKPSPSSRPPDLPVATTAFWVAILILNLIFLATPGGHWWMSAGSIVLACGFLCLLYYEWKQRLVKRSEWRRQRWVDWITAPALPELEPAPDWAAIEEAIGALLTDGVEPTYERARDLIRRHEEWAEEWNREAAQRKIHQKLRDPKVQRALATSHVRYCGVFKTGICNQPGPCAHHRHERRVIRDENNVPLDRPEANPFLRRNF